MSSPDEWRVENGMEMVGLQAIFESHSSRLHPSLRLAAPVAVRPSEAMALSLAGNGVQLYAGRHLFYF